MSNKHVKEAAQRHAAATAEVSRLEQQLGSYIAPDSAAVDQTSDLVAARQAYEDAAAAHALGELDGMALSEAQGRLDAAEQRSREAMAAASSVRAVRAGIERRLATAKADRSAADDALQQAVMDWIEAEQQAAEIEYVNAAQRAAAARVRIESLKTAAFNRGAAIPGPGAWAMSLHLPPLGPHSAKVATELYPASSTHGGYYENQVVPPFNKASASEALERELRALVEVQPAKKSLIGSLLSLR